MSRGGESITIIPEVGWDWQGDPAGVAGDSYDVGGLFVVPKYSREAETIVTGLQIILKGQWPAGVRRINPQDTVHARGQDWNVDGEVALYRGGGAVELGTEVHVKKVGT